MFPPHIHRDRRERLMQLIGPRSVAIFASPPEVLRNGDSHFPFRQSSDLLYLTGFGEPKSTLVLKPDDSRERVVLYVRPRDPEGETWTGRRAGIEGAVATYGADAAYPSDQLGNHLAKLLANTEELHYSVGIDKNLDARVVGTIAAMRAAERKLGRAPTRIVDPRATLHEMRLHKSSEEIETMTEAANIAGEAITAAMRAVRPGMTEYQLQALVEQIFRNRGANGPSFPTIVGCGNNATTLHYEENSASIEKGQLVLIDAGAEYQYYASDISRTFPCGRSFAPAQRDCYKVVLAAQEEAIRAVRPGTTIDKIHQRAVEVLAAGMVELGLLRGDPSQRIADGAYKKYYMHRTSHWLGMDAHDVGDYTTRNGDARLLEPGMVLTIEPGLYIPASDTEAPASLRGIGIRIEDDVLVTADGARVLTASAPKQPDEVC
ncbi:MAG: aminopeptidase P N-terminal domain-containing protein [Pseudomonadota bacterium]